MPNMTNHQAADLVKLLIMADSGSGKTGALAALANAGFELFILDFDNGLDILTSYLKPEAFERVHYETLTDKMKAGGEFGAIPDGVPASTRKAMDLLNRWKDSETGEDFGPVTEFGPGRVVVLDSLTMQGEAAIRHVQAIDGKSGSSKWKYYGPAMEIQEGLLSIFFSETTNTNIIVTAHIVLLGEEDNERGYPSALGKKLPPKVARYFNSVLGMKMVGSGTAARRYIRTVSDPKISYKNSAPDIIPAEILLELDKDKKATGGLAKFFELAKVSASSDGHKVVKLPTKEQ